MKCDCIGLIFCVTPVCLGAIISDMTQLDFVV